MSLNEIKTEKGTSITWEPGRCYSGHELILLATEMEKEGWVIYKYAQRRAGTPEAGELFARMADEELEHIKVLYSDIKPLVDQDNDIDLMNEDVVSEYLVSILDPDMFFNKEVLKQRLKSITTQDEALALCLEGEERSIAFYEGMLGFINCEKAREVVERITALEREHMTTLRGLKH